MTQVNGFTPEQPSEATILLRETLGDAENAQSALVNFTREFEQAIAEKSEAAERLRTAKPAYDDAEAEFTFTVSFGDDEDYAKAKNAETRKIVLDARLSEARRSGALKSAWSALNDAMSRKERAEMAYLMAETRFRGIRYSANLLTAQLNAVVVA